MSEDIAQISPNPVRPQFLTILCVLTFFGSGIGFFMGIAKLISSPGFSFIYGGDIGLMLSVILELLASVFCLLGAFKMWDLFKRGYLLYVIGAVLAVIAAIISVSSFGESVKNSMALGTIPDAMNSVTSWSRFGAKVFIDVLFVVLYGLNRKALVY